MPCCGDREKGSDSLEEKWDYVNLDDFKSESCLTPFSYFWIWYFLVVSLAVYGVDTFTAVNLLAFSRWAGQIEPAIPFTVSRWIYAVCIIISFALLIYRWLYAIRAMRSGNIARSYLNSLAVRVQSIRPGKKGRGWKRFLVFAELTKSKKGAEYVALFTYFSFESWMNTVFADGPRQVVNALTLYSVMQMDLLPGGENAEKSSDSAPGVQFFENIKILAVNNNLRAVVLMGMLFTLVVWVLSVIKLLIAIALYLIFLFHHIPAQDGSLTVYCRRKINTRLKRIVKQKVNKALAKGVVLQDRAPTNPNTGSDMKPTLPAIGDKDDKGPTVTTISRSTTQTTLPPYTSRPGTAAPNQKPTLPDLSWSEGNPSLSRMPTDSSAYSESAVTGYSPLDGQSSPVPPLPPLPSNTPPSAMRSNTPISRPPTNQPRATPAPSGTGRSTPASGYRGMAEPNHAYGAYMPPNPPASAPYRSYSPAPNPYARSNTPGFSVTAPPEMGYPTRTFSPAIQGATPYPPSRGTSPQPGYLMQAFTPISQSVSPGAASVAYPDRTLSPPPMSGTPQPSNYLAFNSSQAPIQPTSSPVYRLDAASPLNGYRRGPSPGPIHSSQVPTPMQEQSLRPYRNDANF